MEEKRNIRLHPVWCGIRWILTFFALVEQHCRYHSSNLELSLELVLPKTCAYVWTVLIGYFAMKKECK